MVAPQKEIKTSDLPSRKKIIVLDQDKKQCRAFCAMLTERDYQAVPVQSLPDLIRYLREGGCLIIIIDLDTIAADNRVIRDLTVQNPGVYFLCLSKDRFHPELKEAICYHIYACINKPIDPDELFFWLRSIYEDEVDTNNKHDA